MTDLKRLEAAYAEVLSAIGVPLAGALLDTPSRAAKALADLTAGSREDLAPHLRVFDEPGADQLVLVGPLPFHSLCEHHLLPFSGVAVVGYVPAPGKILGLSKLPRILAHHARRLQNQERLANAVTDELMAVPGLQPVAAGVLIRSRHTCMAARGIRSPGEMVTCALRGVFRDDHAARSEFLDLARDLLGRA